jgi:hypothetical protein
VCQESVSGKCVRKVCQESVSGKCVRKVCRKKESTKEKQQQKTEHHPTTQPPNVPSADLTNNKGARTPLFCTIIEF